MKKIEEITEEQIARFPEWVDKWTKIGLCTDLMDFQTAKSAVENIYRAIDKQLPEIYTAASPKEAIELGVKLTNGGKDPTKDDLNSALSKLYGGISSAGWVSYITFFRDVMGWEDDTLTDFAYAEQLLKSCYSVWWDDDVCVIIDRPELIKFDEQNTLHCEDGPAIRFRDGYTVYAWHGTLIPREWLETPKSELDVSLALTWEDIEQRRCFSEIIGWHNVLDQLDAKVIDEDGDPEIGTLLEVDLPDIGKERFLRVLCGTGRTFALPVPPEMTTALQAQSWTWGIDETEFVKPEVRT